MTRKKQHGYQVESSAQLPHMSDMNFPTPAGYRNQAIVFFVLGVACCACSFVVLPPQFAAALPLFTKLVAGVGFFACGISNLLAARGLDLRHPINDVFHGIMVACLATLFVWFVFFANLTPPLRAVTGFLFGGATIIFTLPIIMRIAMPGIYNQAVNSAQIEIKKSRDKG